MSISLSNQELTIYNLIRDAICKYAFSILVCSKEDIVLLSKDISVLVDSKKLNESYHQTMYNVFAKYLKNISSNELKNLTSYVNNHFFNMKNKN